MEIKKSEVGELIVASIVLGLVFGFDDGLSVFDAAHWFLNFAVSACFSFLFLLLFYVATKSRAAKEGASVDVRVWRGRRYGLRKSSVVKHGVPLGVVVPLLVAFISYGYIPFASTLSVSVKGMDAWRLAKKFRRVADIELAKIQLAGPLMLMWAALLIKIISPESPLVFMALLIGLCQMLPLPGLNGLYVYFGSPLMYVFYVVLLLGLLVSLPFLSAGWSVLIALVLACVLFLVYYQRKMVLGLPR